MSWKFQRIAEYEERAKLLGKPVPEHEGYYRDNDGSWIVQDENGARVSAVTFKGTAKRGQQWNAPDPVGQERARLIAATPDLLTALADLSDAASVYQQSHSSACDCQLCVAINKADRTIRLAKGEREVA